MNLQKIKGTTPEKPKRKTKISDDGNTLISPANIRTPQNTYSNSPTALSGNSSIPLVLTVWEWVFLK